MVVHDLNFARTRRGPHETYPPLVIDPDAVLTDSASLEGLQPVARRHSKLVEFVDGIQQPQLDERLPVETRIKALDALPLEQSLSVAIGEGDDHAVKVYREALLTPSVKLSSRCTHPPPTQHRQVHTPAPLAPMKSPIRPFRDGNGRITRVLWTVFLGRGGVLEPVSSSGGEWVGRNTDGYYAVVIGVGQGGWK